LCRPVLPQPSCSHRSWVGRIAFSGPCRRSSRPCKAQTLDYRRLSPSYNPRRCAPSRGVQPLDECGARQCSPPVGPSSAPATVTLSQATAPGARNWVGGGITSGFEGEGPAPCPRRCSRPGVLPGDANRATSTGLGLK